MQIEKTKGTQIILISGKIICFKNSTGQKHRQAPKNNIKLLKLESET